MPGSKRKMDDMEESEKEDEDVRMLEENSESPGKYELNPMHLQVFYERLFPFNEMFRWLVYGQDPDSQDETIDKGYFQRREFTFIKEGDIYLRYKCFKNLAEYKSEVKKHRPLRIEIGPFYNVAPSIKSSVTNFKPVEKELVFDIDMTDYDDVRECCQDKAICRQCWVLMSCAIHVLDTALRADFGFKHLLWVFSGRRGVHCWVADKRARHLTNDGRYAIGQYLNVYIGGEKGSPVELGFWPLHPSLERGFNICKEYFYAFAEAQDLFGTDEKIQRIVDMIPKNKLANATSSIHDRIAEEWLGVHKDKSARFKFDLLVNTVDGEARKAKPTELKYYREMKLAYHAIVMTFVYPRLDINVTRQLNHLLKSPFVVHPGTGNVCVPIPVRNSQHEWIADQFDPLEPNLRIDAIHDELNKNMNLDKKTDIAKTSLQRYKQYFIKSFLEPLSRSIRQEKSDAVLAM